MVREGQRLGRWKEGRNLFELGRVVQWRDVLPTAHPMNVALYPGQKV